MKKIALFLVLVFMFSTLSLAFVGLPVSGFDPDKDIAPIQAMTPITIINTIIQVVFWLLLFVATLFFLYGAYLFLMGGAEEESQKKAKSVIMYGVIAIVVAFIALGLSNWIVGLLS